MKSTLVQQVVSIFVIAAYSFLQVLVYANDSDIFAQAEQALNKKNIAMLSIYIASWILSSPILEKARHVIE